LLFEEIEKMDADFLPGIVEALPARIHEAARAYSTRRVPAEAMLCLRNDLVPSAGDLVLARVDSVGQHKRLHTVDGSRKNLFAGDLVIVVYGDRYAPNQYEALVPRDLRDCDLAAGGGIAGRVVARHEKMRGPTRLHPLGLVASDPDGPPLNLGGFGLAPPAYRGPIRVPVVAVVGTSMDAGKTTTSAHLVRGLRNHGHRVGYAKVTGTAAAGDPGLLRDAGAHLVLDFTDAGFASTYRLPSSTVEAIFDELVLHLAAAGVDSIVIEVADGLLQRETASLLQSRTFRSRVNGVIFTAADSLGAVGGVQWLRERKLPIVGLSGRMLTSPLQVAEAIAATHLSVYGLKDLLDPATAAKLVAGGSVLGVVG
jgi:dethiobiotin synthetase